MNVHFKHGHLLGSLINEVIYNSKPLDKTIEHIFKSISGLSSNEKEFIFQLITNIIRHWIMLNAINKKLFKTQKFDFYNIHLILHCLEENIHRKKSGFNKIEKQIIDAYDEYKQIRHLRESFPLWLDNKCFEEKGTDWEKLASALNRHPEMILRVNSSKISIFDLCQKLRSTGKIVSLLENSPNALRMDRFYNIFKSEEFQQGMFEMQDAGSQKIAPFLEADEGMRVIDACAGNGGKTLHLSNIMNNKGKIIALDIADHKLEVLKKRMKRAGAFNIETKHINSSKVVKRLYNSADRLLLDVPCSGLGVLKRNPDIKHHLSEERINSLLRTQGEILDKYSGMVTRNGLMVYATCSILPSENQNQVQRFLENKQGAFELLEDQTISPIEGHDGFYMAKLRRIS